MISLKKLEEGGTDKVAAMFEEASVLGVDIIELMWKEKFGQPRRTSAQIIGVEVPRTGIANSFGDIDVSSGIWQDGTLTFFPDQAGRCWGYIYDTPNNRKVLHNSFNNDRFMIVDKRVRDEIKEEALQLGIDVEPAEMTEIKIKKTKREIEAEKHAEELQKKLDDLERREKQLKEELAVTKGEKTTYVEKRLKGVKIDKSQVEPKEEDAN